MIIRFLRNCFVRVGGQDRYRNQGRTTARERAKGRAVATGTSLSPALAVTVSAGITTPR